MAATMPAEATETFTTKSYFTLTTGPQNISSGLSQSPPDSSIFFSEAALYTLLVSSATIVLLLMLLKIIELVCFSNYRFGQAYDAKFESIKKCTMIMVMSIWPRRAQEQHKGH